jgi:uncharacterized Zn finger protein (UPF0148 family)
MSCCKNANFVYACNEQIDRKTKQQMALNEKGWKGAKITHYHCYTCKSVCVYPKTQMLVAVAKKSSIYCPCLNCDALTNWKPESH